MIKRTHITSFLFALCALAPAACSGTKESLGLNKKAPDEFAVVKHAPLAMPPDYYLRPPTPGAPRPQEGTTSDQAKAAVFGGDPTAQTARAEPTSAEEALVMQAGGQTADPDIRRRIDSETDEMAQKHKPVAKRILGVVTGDDTAPASVVDPGAEVERMNKNAETGKPVTEGETPSKIE